MVVFELRFYDAPGCGVLFFFTVNHYPSRVGGVVIVGTGPFSHYTCQS